MCGMNAVVEVGAEASKHTIQCREGSRVQNEEGTCVVEVAVLVKAPALGG